MEVRARDWISPEDVPAAHPFTMAFAHAEPEYMAIYMVRFLRSRGAGWDTFLMKDFTDWLRQEQGRKSPTGMSLLNPFVDLVKGMNELAEKNWVSWTDGSVEVTDEFVLRCYLSGSGLWTPLERLLELIHRVKAETERQYRSDVAVVEHVVES